MSSRDPVRAVLGTGHRPRRQALLVLDRPVWRLGAVLGVAFSVPALTMSATAGAAGLVVDALVLTAVAVSTQRQRRVQA